MIWWLVKIVVGVFIALVIFGAGVVVGKSQRS